MRLRVILALVILIVGCAWRPEDAPVPVTLIQRPYGAHYERLTGGTIPPFGVGPASLPVPEGYYGCELSTLVPSGVSFRDFLATHLEWRIPYQYGFFDCTEMTAAIEWLAESTGHDARITCSAMHCWVQIQLEDGNYYYYEAVQLVWVDDAGYYTHPYVFEDIAEALAFVPWEGQFAWWTIPPGGPGGTGGTHAVQAGEHLWAIARAYSVSPDNIAAASGISVGSILRPGQILTIPDIKTNLPPGPTARRQFGETPAPVVPAPVPVEPVQSSTFSPELPFRVINTVEPVYTVQGTLSPGWRQSILQWKTLIEQYAAQYSLDPNLVAAVMMYESAGRARVTSYMGAVGLMQVMPRETGFPDRPTISTLLDPASNLLWGCKILRACIDGHGAYNGLKCYYGFGGTFTESYARDVWALYLRHREG